MERHADKQAKRTDGNCESETDTQSESYVSDCSVCPKLDSLVELILLMTMSFLKVKKCEEGTNKREIEIY